MPINLNSREKFRLINKQGNYITTSTNIKAENVKLQIDINKNNKFDYKEDITITDTDTIKLLLDNIKGNVPSIDCINFTEKIEEHILKNREISILLNEAKVLGKKSKETSILNMDKKIEYGKKAFTSVQNAYFKDKGNPDALLTYGLSLININKSTFRETASKKLGININKLTEDLAKELQSDNKNILNLLILRGLNKFANKDNLEMTKEYSITENKFNISLKESE